MAPPITPVKEVDERTKDFLTQYLLLHGVDAQDASALTEEAARINHDRAKAEVQKRLLDNYRAIFPYLDDCHCPLAEARAALYLNDTRPFSAYKSLNVFPPIASVPSISRVSMKAEPFLTLGVRFRLFLKKLFKRKHHAP
jgi:hypothetical protein